ncbi:F-box domain protein [Metarhizium robertsii]|uniref:F-box domain, cyclin-like protein n=2 Tax=Metarhizium robertsii TaxID=568076 RepID=E9EK39_METRA|nr:F-box domain, cyclin-like protein [Metarhizium robertsii ARSEF 23]EFZ03050.1 F-box domain, cyclin-like protein [Metarhizium robertsii ARSEF 23]EXU96689.1 F-box domain protein [Metarhizium robertsii]
MDETHPDPLDPMTYTTQRLPFRDNTLDNAQLTTRCPLDNGRHTDASIPARHSVGQLDQLPAELLIQVLLCTDIPSLTAFRRVNRRAMELVDSVPEYAAIIKHCPDIIRAILAVEADAFDCRVLYRTLSTSRCSTCSHFGDFLYLVDCRRVCYFCFTERLEYFPLTIGRASRLLTPDPTRPRVTRRQLLREANPPSILSLPGRYCASWNGDGGKLARNRLQLFDRRALIQDLEGSGLPNDDKFDREPLRFMAIITAPYLFDSGRQADWGYFCLGCGEESDDEETTDVRMKYLREEVLEHMVRYGPVREVPDEWDTFMHVKQI